MAELNEAQKGKDTAGGAAGAGGGDAVGKKQPGAADAVVVAAPVFPPEAKTAGLAWLREVTTTAIAVVIVAVTLVLLWRTFDAAAGDFEKKKAVMLYGLTILGTVVGYYFGRVPAERRAEASERKASEAQATATTATTAAAQSQQQVVQTAQEKEEATKKLAEAKAGVEKAKAALAPPGAPGRKTLGGAPEPGAPADGSREAYVELEVLSRLL